jgi:hypothetical protein
VLEGNGGPTKGGRRRRVDGQRAGVEGAGSDKMSPTQRQRR